MAAHTYLDDDDSINRNKLGQVMYLNKIVQVIIIVVLVAEK